MSARLAEAVLRAAVRRGWIAPAAAEAALPGIAGTPRDGLAAALRRHGAAAVAERFDQLLPPLGHPGFGAWTPLARLGGGAMGAVWLAAEGDGPLVVAKTAAGPTAAPLADAGGSVWLGGGAARPAVASGLAERFAREAAITAGLSHPRIVPCRGGGVAADGTRYLILAWVPAGDLADRLRRSGPLTVAQALAVADQLADALAHAHARGVVHRDVKPGNVFAHDDGAVLLGDFGLARPTAAGATRLTMAGVAVGTPASMAPEQVDGNGAIGPATDLYGLGCLLFECLAGRLPFAGRSAEVMHAHRTLPPPDLAVLVPGLPPGAAALVARLLAKRPEDRPASAAAVRAELAPLLARAGLAPGSPLPFTASSPAPTPLAAAVRPAGLPAAVLLADDADVAVVLWAARRIVLGRMRGPGIDLVVRDYPEEEHRARLARLSRRHCAIAIASDGSAAVEDLGSGRTRLDGAGLAPGFPRPLRRGAEHALDLAGACNLRLRAADAAVAITRPGNRPGLAYAAIVGSLAIGGPASDLPLAGARRSLAVSGGDGLLVAGEPLRDGAEIDLDGRRLRARPLGDWL